MESAEAQKQIEQMMSFILSEATDKANEIKKKGEEEFEIEKHRILTASKERIRQNYEKKSKQVETQYAINKSLAINRQRLEKIKARQEVMARIHADVQAKLIQDLKAGDASQKFTTKLIAQGLLMLLENEVTVKCRKCDADMVKNCLDAAAQEYARVVKAESGATKTCKLTIAHDHLPPPPAANQEGASCLGGVVLSCQGGKITIDNTIDLRLNLVMEQDKPEIRKALFPQP